MASRRPGTRPAHSHHRRHAEAASGSLSHRIRLPGRNDEFRELADTFDTMLPGLKSTSPNSKDSRPMPPTNCAPHSRSPRLFLTSPATTRPREGDLEERLRAVNARAIELTEALLLLSRTDQRSFTQVPVDLSLIAEEATETLLPLAEKCGITIETSGDIAHAVGSQALLLQLTTNLVHNGIVHNLPQEGTVWVKTSVQPNTVLLEVENTGEKLTSQTVSTLVEPFQRGPNAYTPIMQVSASAWRSSKASPKRTTEPSPSPPGRWWALRHGATARHATQL